jgi:hypothetical protein
MQPLALPDRRLAMQLSGILRLANALDHPSRNHPTMRGAVEPVPRLELSAPGHSVVVRVAGYSPLDPSAERTAGARHLRPAAACSRGKWKVSATRDIV